MGNILESINFSKGMSVAMIAALQNNPHPNPKVGAALFDATGKLKLATTHKKKGTNHAEIDILNNNIDSTDTLYVTLEPCFHDDTSPSCAKKLANSSIKNITIGDIDSDPRTNGKGYNHLIENGINVKIEKGVNDFINPYYKHKSNQDLPIYSGKLGLSSNNFIYDSNSQNKYITNKLSLKITHLLRGIYDAILIGKNTLLIDKPLLTIRSEYLNNSNNNPLKIVLWGSDVPKDILNNSNYDDFLFIESKDIDVIDDFLNNMKCKSVLVEGGKDIHNFFIDNNKYSYFYEFKSKNHIKEGLNIGTKYIDFINNKMILSNKFLLQDNEFRTYTNS